MTIEYLPSWENPADSAEQLAADADQLLTDIEAISTERILSNRHLMQLCAFIAFNIVDLVTTEMVLDNGGKELNPFAQEIVHSSDGEMIAYKAILATSFVCLVHFLGWIKYDTERISTRALTLANATLAFFIISNLAYFVN